MGADRVVGQPWFHCRQLLARQGGEAVLGDPSKVIQEIGLTDLDRRWFIVQNRGRGDALDVTLDVVKINGEVSPMGVPVRIGRWETVAFGESAEIKFVTETGEVKEPLESGDTYVDRGHTRTFLWGGKPENVEVIVTWSQHPNTRKRRQRTYTIKGDFTLSTVIDAFE